MTMAKRHTRDRVSKKQVNLLWWDPTQLYK